MGDPLTKSYNNLLYVADTYPNTVRLTLGYRVDGFSAPSPLKMFIEHLIKYFPEPLVHALYQYSRIKRLHENRDEVHKVAKVLLQNKEETLLDAFEYKPEKWLEDKPLSTPALGLYGNCEMLAASQAMVAECSVD
jgi:hypothetical protein